MMWARFTQNYAFSEQGSGVSLYWSGFDLTVDGSTLTATVTKLGEPINEVLSNDTSAIAAVCP